MTTGKREAIRAPLSRGSLRRSRALQTAESLCRSSAHAAAQLEKRAQHSARDRLRRLPRAVPPPYLGREGQSSARVPPGGAQPGFTQPLLASRKDTQHISAPCPASQLCLNSASWTREVHKPQPSPHFLPVARRLSRSPKGSLQSLTEIKGVTLRSTGDASPPTSSSWGRNPSPRPHKQPELLWGASWERKAAPAGAAGCRCVPSHFKGCPAGSKCASPGAQVRAGCAHQHTGVLHVLWRNQSNIF